MEMNAPLVSVIMPAYNAGKYIAEAINSVVEQTYASWELIVVDDGSTDSTASAIKEWQEKDARIRYIYQDNGGQGKARNNGLGKATGKYIAFLDADDLWLPWKLSTQVDLLLVNNVDLTFSDSYIFDVRPSVERKMNITAGYYQGEEAVRKFLFCNHIPILTVLASKSAIDKVKGFSEIRELTEDYHLWIRLLIDGNSFLGIDSPLAYYREHSLSSSSADGKEPFLTLNCLREIESVWPEYSGDIKHSMYLLVNDHLSTMNISKWLWAERLLIIRNSLSKEIISISFWKTIYSVFGKNIFRKMFNAKMKLKSGPDGIKKDGRFHLPVLCFG